MQRFCLGMLLITASACGSLDSIDDVHDLRMLGVSAQPPDQAVVFDANGIVTTATIPVEVKALIADPMGNGRAVSYSFAVCASLDTGGMTTSMNQGGGGGPFAAQSPSTANYRCLPTDYQEFASGSVSPTGGWAEVSATFTAMEQILYDNFELDNYHGLGGLRLPVQVTVSAGSEMVVGTKLVVYTLVEDSAYVPNANPVLEGISVNNVSWSENTPFLFSQGSKPSADGWTLQPVFDPNLQVPYTQLSFTRTPLSFQELWLFDYFSTFGGFSPTTAGGQSVVSSKPEPSHTEWLPSSFAAAAGTFWFVVRDGRGGESWLVRDAVLGP